MKPWRPPRSATSARGRVRRWFLIPLGALVCYAAAYVAFSTWGQYVATTADPLPAGVVREYEWAPGEFFDYSDHSWRWSHVVVFYPLLWLDHRVWHTPEAARSGRYPVSLTAPQEPVR